jgi:cupin fold WbuC family metalloprotein
MSAEGSARTGEALSREAVEYVTRPQLERLARQAAGHPRGRINHNYHRYRDGYQRLLNVVQPGSYIRPHRHRQPAKSESFVVLQGEIGFFQFGDEGDLLAAHRIGPRRAICAVDLAPGVWHCFLALAPDSVVFEAKNGPYDAERDKEFAPWAPAEGEAASADYMGALLRALPRAEP